MEDLSTEERPPGFGTADPGMPPTDTADPAYFHKVVDCQWACPAHTPVPEYIRLIAAGRYADAYMVNWHSNVFPGILGRTCDRPVRARLPPRPGRGGAGRDLPPEARRRRQQGRHPSRLPPPARLKNGKRVALVGAGPASLTVARDLLPLGYDVVLFDKDPRAGGMMRTPDPDVPPARERARRGGRLHPRPRAGAAARPDDREPEGAARRRGSTRSSSAAARRAGANLSSPAGRRPRPTSTSASTGSRASRSATSSGSAAACSSLAAATPRWTAAAPRAGSAART